MKKGILLPVLICLCVWPAFLRAEEYTLKSPDGLLEIKIDLDTAIEYSLYRDGRLMLDRSPISLMLDNQTILGEKPVVSKKRNRKEIKETIPSPFYRKPVIETVYNELDLTFKGKYGIRFRAYNDGIAYRFYTTFNHDITVAHEQASFHFDRDYPVYCAYTTAREDKDPFAMAFQNIYEETTVSQAGEKLAFLPLTVDFADELKLTILESDLENYPGMFLQTHPSGNGLQGVFAPYPARMDYYPWRKMKYVAGRENYIARTEGNREYPWRILAVTTRDVDMPANDLVYALASPNRIGDISWIETGKVAWEWWNDWGISGVDFVAGINMDTYKHYIDFASENGIEFVVLDEGWYDPKSGDMLTVIPELNLEELVRYAAAKNVKLILWTVFNVLDEQLEEACAKYAAMGISGFKVDFLDRDDQTAVEMVYRIAEATGRHKLSLDLHGIYKPTGLNRTYPHIINFEAVFGMEEVKWSTIEKDMMQYDVMMPYIRMMAGPVDYTPGAMRNATKQDFKDIYYNPMSQGTRCHQLAAYIVHDSPITMLADNPTIYRKEQECTDFIVSIPNTGFDETRILQGKLGESIVVARRVGETWYIGGMTNWDSRETVLDFSFLADGEYKATLFEDGVNAAKQATDYKKVTITINKTTRLPIQLAPGGGFAMVIKK